MDRRVQGLAASKRVSLVDISVIGAIGKVVMIGLSSISFDTEGWEQVKQSSEVRVWVRGHWDSLRLSFCSNDPGVPAPLSQIDRIRHVLREQSAEANGGLVEVEVGELGSLPALRVIVKQAIDPLTIDYSGTWTIPRRHFSFVIWVHCSHVGITGLRRAFARHELLQSGELEVRRLPQAADQATQDSNRAVAVDVGWAQDPYLPDYEGPCLRNMADDERWDSRFPKHPLSRVRTTMRTIESSVLIDQPVLSAEPFESSRTPSSLLSRLLRR